MVAQIDESAFEGARGAAAGAVVFGTPGKELASDLFELRFHLAVISEVELLEVVDEFDEPVQRLLMNAVGLALAHATQHFIAELRGLLPQLGDALADEVFDPSTNSVTGVSGCIETGASDFILVSEGDQFQTEVFGDSDLEELDGEGELVFDELPGWEGSDDLCIQGLGLIVGLRHLSGGFPPIVESVLPGRPVVAEELILRIFKTNMLRVQLFLHIHQFGVWQEMTDTSEEGKGAFLDDGMGPGFDEGECGERFLGQELFVTETEEALVDLIRFKTEVGGIQFLVETRVSHTGVDENAFASEDAEEVCLVLGCRVHDYFGFVGLGYSFDFFDWELGEGGMKKARCSRAASLRCGNERAFFCLLVVVVVVAGCRRGQLLLCLPKCLIE